RFCDTGETCTDEPSMFCPAGTVCTVTTTGRWFDADQGIDYRMWAESVAGRGDTEECSTGFDGDRCTATATQTVIGPAGLSGECELDAWGTGAVLGAYEPGNDFIRRIECRIDLHIEEAPPLVPFVGGSDVSLVAPSAGTLSMSAKIGGL